MVKKNNQVFWGVKVVLYFVAKFSFQRYPTKDLRSKSKSCENVPNVEELIIIQIISKHLPGGIFVGGCFVAS